MTLAIDTGTGLRSIRVVDQRGADVCRIQTSGCSCVLIRAGHDATFMVEQAYERAAFLEDGGTVVIDHVHGSRQVPVPARSQVLCAGVPLHGVGGAHAVRLVEVCPLGARGHIFDTIVGVSVSDMGFVLANRRLVDAYVARSGTSDVLGRATTTDEGDALIRSGALFPVMGLVPWTYLIGVAAPGVGLDAEWREGGPAHRVRVTEPVDLCDGNWMTSWRPHAEAHSDESASPCSAPLKTQGR